MTFKKGDIVKYVHKSTNTTYLSIFIHKSLLFDVRIYKGINRTEIINVEYELDYLQQEDDVEYMTHIDIPELNTSEEYVSYIKEFYKKLLHTIRLLIPEEFI